MRVIEEVHKGRGNAYRGLVLALIAIPLDKRGSTGLVLSNQMPSYVVTGALRSLGVSIYRR